MRKIHRFLPVLLCILLLCGCTAAPAPAATATPEPTATLTPPPTATSTEIPSPTETPVPTPAGTNKITPTVPADPTKAPTPTPTATPVPVPTCTLYIITPTEILHGPVSIAINDESTAMSVLIDYCDSNAIPYNMTVGYLRELAGLKERGDGPLSGWVYFVNGDQPQKGPTNYAISDGDTLCWIFSKELGRDAYAYLPE